MKVSEDLALKRFHWKSVVYFVAGETGPIKIGFTRELHCRLRSLRNSSPTPLGLLAVAEGGRDLEREYHARFAVHRLHGEWFERCEDIEEEIARLVWTPRIMHKFKSFREKAHAPQA